MNAKEKLKEKMRELFQFGQADLDFGIYRILNYKRDRIEKFINDDLINKVNESLISLQKGSSEDISKDTGILEKKIKELEEQIGEKILITNGISEKWKDKPIGKEYIELQTRKNQLAISDHTEEDIYNKLYVFFSRYYSEGDFLNQRRMGKSAVYSVNYNGQETFFHWATKDMYYIKSTEFFYLYRFKLVNDVTVNFRVETAEEETGNVKSETKKDFFYSRSELVENELDIYFQYRELNKEEEEENKKIAEIIEKDIKKLDITKIRPLFEIKNDKTLLSRRLNQYFTRNKTDYFIHKDLKGFLSGELDFYIKNEVLELDDLSILSRSEYYDKVQLYLLKADVVRDIGLKIIEFLSQLENYQKMLWEKKKFVLDTHYVITLDKIAEYCGEEFVKSILPDVINNKEQINEWKELFDLDIKNTNDLSDGGMFTSYKKLPVDTRYFDIDFKVKLLCQISSNHNLDEVLNGLLIKSDNYHGLNLLQEKYREKVKCIYIDPPYNTAASEIIYKNEYKHSSWLTLMDNRFQKIKNLLKNIGIIFIAIDDLELFKLNELLEIIFSRENFIANVSVIHKPEGRNQEKFFGTSNEYMIVYAKNKSETNFNNVILDIEKIEEFENSDEKGSYKRKNFIRLTDGKYALRNSKPDFYYPIYISADLKIIQLTDFHNAIAIYPITEAGVERTWKTKPDTFLDYLKNGNIEILKENNHITIYEKLREFQVIKTHWIRKEYHSYHYGTKPLENILGFKLFDFPKSIITVLDTLKLCTKDNDLILDYFAGSGTTAHAVMMLNKEDGGNRKYMLIEQAEYFNTVIIPRIKKVQYSFDWKEGKPQNMDGIGGFFKYHTLEQYEDSLENIEFDDKKGRGLEFEDYMLKYFLREETKKSALDISRFDMPFDYKINVIENYETVSKRVDLPETFNYLIGMNVEKVKTIKIQDQSSGNKGLQPLATSSERKCLIISGLSENDRKTLIIWRELPEGCDYANDFNIFQGYIKEEKPSIVYINGDPVLNPGDFEIRSIESHFAKKMFGE